MLKGKLKHSIHGRMVDYCHKPDELDDYECVENLTLYHILDMKQTWCVWMKPITYIRNVCKWGWVEEEDVLQRLSTVSRGTRRHEQTFSIEIKRRRAWTWHRNQTTPIWYLFSTYWIMYAFWKMFNVLKVIFIKTCKQNPSSDMCPATILGMSIG